MYANLNTDISEHVRNNHTIFCGRFYISKTYKVKHVNKLYSIIIIFCIWILNIRRFHATDCVKVENINRLQSIVSTFEHSQSHFGFRPTTTANTARPSRAPATRAAPLGAPSPHPTHTHTKPNNHPSATPTKPPTACRQQPQGEGRARRGVAERAAAGGSWFFSVWLCARAVRRGTARAALATRIRAPEVSE